MKTRTIVACLAVVGFAAAFHSFRTQWKKPQIAWHAKTHQPSVDRRSVKPLSAVGASDASPRRQLPSSSNSEAHIARSVPAAVFQNPSPEPPQEPEKSKRAAKIGRSAAAAANVSQKKPPADPVARIALSFVGADDQAEAYWIDAINDPNLSPHERQDLIEDLNEEGFSDPHHPTLEDLPLIVNRLMIIEELAPDAMDEVNGDAFEEAKKDLERMAYLAQQ